MRAQCAWLAAGFVLAANLVVCQAARAQSGQDPLGATVDGLRAAGRQLSPTVRAATLDTEASFAKAEGAGALDDPTISDSYQYYKDPGVFSAHTVMLSQSFPLWGKRDLRRRAAVADVEAARGRERAAQDETDERIKVAYAQYYLIGRDMEVNRQTGELARRMRSATALRFGQGEGGEDATLQAMDAETAAKAETIRLQGEKAAARARLNGLIARSPDASLVDPVRERPLPAREPVLPNLLIRARNANPTLAAGDAAVAAARTRTALAARAWYPDITVGAGPLIQTNNRPVGFAATVGFNVPVPWGREASGQREAAAQLGASQQRYEAAFLEVQDALAEAVARYHAARATESLLKREALPQARAAFQASLAGYSQGKGQLATAITIANAIHNVELRMLQTELDEQVELAAIERLIGGDL